VASATTGANLFLTTPLLVLECALSRTFAGGADSVRYKAPPPGPKGTGDVGCGVASAEYVTVKALPKALRARAPLSIVATAAAADGARAAWEGAVPPRPCRLYHLSPDPDPVAVRLDLRPWGYDRVALSEEDGAGLAPRADLL